MKQQATIPKCIEKTPQGALFVCKHYCLRIVVVCKTYHKTLRLFPLKMS